MSSSAPDAKPPQRPPPKASSAALSHPYDHPTSGGANGKLLHLQSNGHHHAAAASHSALAAVAQALTAPMLMSLPSGINGTAHSSKVSYLRKEGGLALAEVS